VGGFSKEAFFVVLTCHRIFRGKKAQNENKDLPNEAPSERSQENCQKRPIKQKHFPKWKRLQNLMHLQSMHLYSNTSASHY